MAFRVLLVHIKYNETYTVEHGGYNGSYLEYDDETYSITGNSYDEIFDILKSHGYELIPYYKNFFSECAFNTEEDKEFHKLNSHWTKGEKYYKFKEYKLIEFIFEEISDLNVRNILKEYYQKNIIIHPPEWYYNAKAKFHSYARGGINGLSYLSIYVHISGCQTFPSWEKTIINNMDNLVMEIEKVNKEYSFEHIIKSNIISELFEHGSRTKLAIRA